MEGWELAQVNVARLLAPLESPQLADFVADLDPVNALADAAPGFRWRLQTEDGNATAIRAFEWGVSTSAGLIVNLSVWESVEALAAFVYSGRHREVLRRRREWFETMREAYTALWWVPAAQRPSTQDAEERIRHCASTARDRTPSPCGGPSRQLTVRARSSVSQASTEGTGSGYWPMRPSIRSRNRSA